MLKACLQILVLSVCCRGTASWTEPHFDKFASHKAASVTLYCAAVIYSQSLELSETGISGPLQSLELSELGSWSPFKSQVSPEYTKFPFSARVSDQVRGFPHLQRAQASVGPPRGPARQLQIGGSLCWHLQASQATTRARPCAAPGSV